MNDDKKALLEEHLPYELDMLQAADDFLNKADFAQYREVPFLKNTAIECFWMHARNLLEFFRQTSNTTSTASPRDFTTHFDHDKLGRVIEDEINRAITHLQYGRKSQPVPTLSSHTMVRVKEHIDKEVKKFEAALTSDSKTVWKPRPRPETIAVPNLSTATNATTSASLLLIFPSPRTEEATSG